MRPNQPLTIEASPVAALEHLAELAAMTLVSDALTRIATQGLTSRPDIQVAVIGHAHAIAPGEQLEPRTLPPASTDAPRRRGRKPGPKPGRRGRRKARQAPAVHVRRGRQKKAARVTASASRPAPGAPAPGDQRADDFSDRRCRNTQCLKVGTAQLVPGTTRTLRCSACKHTWDARAKRSEGKGHRAPAAAPQPPTEPLCGRCDHDESAHAGENGKCLVPRCICQGFYA